MRIRFKKSAVLLGVIAGAAIATALVVYNVNQGDSINVSDMDGSGFLNGLSNDIEGALSGKEDDDPTAIADADSGDTAASAGVVEVFFGDETENAAVTTDEKIDDPTGELPVDMLSEGADGSSSDTDNKSADVEEPAEETGISFQQETYVETIPQVRTETVVDKRVVNVEVPVTVVEEITEDVEADPVYFYSETGAAAAGELTTTRRAQEALAAKQADMERIEAAAKNSADEEWRFPNSDNYGDSFVVLY